MKLSSKFLSDFSNTTKSNLSFPTYDRDKTEIGIVHLGPGAFHRAHQVAYTEAVLNQFGGNWGISAVSMRSATARDILEQQDCLYTLAILDQNIKYQVIGAIKEVLVATEQLPEVLARMSNPATKLVTLTVTEKGYCLDTAGKLDLNHKDIQHDLANPTNPISAIGLIVQALKLRFTQGIKAFNVISCDNLPSNGEKLRNAVIEFAKQQQSSELAFWIDEQVSFPSTMVDSITPKTDQHVIGQVEDVLGAKDEWPIQREEFLQWVIEDTLKGERPQWEKVGVIFSNNIDAFENAKLRILNGLHSSLAYLGLLAGLTSVKEAISNKDLYEFCQRMLVEEIIPSFEPPAELNVTEYAQDIIRRFENPQIIHLLSQIAWDGSQKIPVRILGTLKDNLDNNQSIKLLSVSVAAWIRFIHQTALNDGELTDPKADILLATAKQFSGNAESDVKQFMQIEGLIASDLVKSEVFTSAVTEAYSLLQGEQDNPLGVLNKI